MERSVQLIVAGGLVLVAGLWILAAGDLLGQWRYAGAAVAVLGVAVSGAGIARDLTYGPFRHIP
jgi:hypothetical protein